MSGLCHRICKNCQKSPNFWTGPVQIISSHCKKCKQSSEIWGSTKSASDSSCHFWSQPLGSDCAPTTEPGLLASQGVGRARCILAPLGQRNRAAKSRLGIALCALMIRAAAGLILLKLELSCVMPHALLQLPSSDPWYQPSPALVAVKPCLGVMSIAIGQVVCYRRGQITQASH